MKLKHLIQIAALLACLPMGAAHASDYMTNRRIVNIGCHHVNGTCYVSLDGDLFGAAEKCPRTMAGSHEFRFDNADTPDGRRTYASLLAAFLSQRPVTVAIEVCSAQGWPTLHYFSIAAQ